MAFIQTVPAEQATDKLQELYNDDLHSLGYIANHTQAMSLRPEVNAAWRNLIGTIRSKMRLRRYELVTIAAAAALRCTYCLLAHGAVLRKNFFTAEQVVAILRDYRQAGLEPEEVAMMALAEKVTLEAQSVTPQDIENLRGYGLTDAEILDVILAAAARNFFSKVLDAIGAEPDAVYLELDPQLREALVKGRAFEAMS
ncbi:MAG: peroxidase-related enzyme [Anaerolineae bacterium]